MSFQRNFWDWQWAIIFFIVGVAALNICNDYNSPYVYYPGDGGMASNSSIPRSPGDGGMASNSSIPRSPGDGGMASNSSIPRSPGDGGMASNSSIPRSPGDGGMASNSSIPRSPGSNTQVIPGGLDSNLGFILGFNFLYLILSTIGAILGGLTARLFTRNSQEQFIFWIIMAFAGSRALLYLGILLWHSCCI